MMAFGIIFTQPYPVPVFDYLECVLQHIEPSILLNVAMIASL